VKRRPGGTTIVLGGETGTIIAKRESRCGIGHLHHRVSFLLESNSWSREQKGEKLGLIYHFHVKRNAEIRDKEDEEYSRWSEK
jgi:hypothetical protein